MKSGPFGRAEECSARARRRLPRSIRCSSWFSSAKTGLLRRFLRPAALIHPSFANMGDFAFPLLGFPARFAPSALRVVGSRNFFGMPFVGPQQLRDLLRIPRPKHLIESVR